MKIAIVGAPGSGKSELAQALAAELEVTIIDDYVEDIGVEADLSMGGDASYIGNLYVVLGRYARERKAWAKGEDTITVGSLIESSVYAALHAMTQHPGEESKNWTRITNFMNLLGSFFQDTMNPGYDHIFALNVEDADPQSVQGAIDKNLFVALNSFKLPYTPLPTSPEKRLEVALAEIGGTDAEDVQAEALE